jgi:acetate kinase
MKILTLNCGSSSVKATLIDTAQHTRLIDVRITEIGSQQATLIVDGNHRALRANDHPHAVTLILETIEARIQQKPAAVAHRVAHGGEEFTQATLIDARVEQRLDTLSALAPLHNPVALAGIHAARTALPSIPHIAVFDTAFHITLPEHARLYALPLDLSRRLGIRRFGFHGLNHAHVAHTVAAHLNASVEHLRIVSCHLGSGASVTAIDHGRSVETSMGMTPLEGLIMGSRPGDIDAGVLLHLLRKGEVDVDGLDTLLNTQCGLKGLTGSNDMRVIEERAARGDETCQLAIDAYAHRVRKYIGAYAAVMGGVDAIAFTAGVGENSSTVRARISKGLDFLGATLDDPANRAAHVDAQRPLAAISTASSRTHLFVVWADEEMMLAREAASLLDNSSSH